MILSHSVSGERPGRRLLLSIASTVFLASGCSNLVSTAPSIDAESAAGKLAGRVHGGNQPVAFATVKLYFAGQSGIASPGILAATTTTADDGSGSFSFTKSATNGQTNSGTTNTFSCPSAGGTPYVYVVARGGNTLNTHDNTVNNVASVFIAPVGLCTSIDADPANPTFTYMSEAVTAATVAAVHNFMNITTAPATDDIGADGIIAGYDGLQNAFNTVSNLVSLSTGQTIASAALTGPATGVTVTETPEQAKLNQVANILSSCINTATSASTQCTRLFAYAAPPPSASTTSTPTASFHTATDVLQAAYYMFTNATSTSAGNRTNLYNLAGGTAAPYQPTLTAVPSDWSIGIQYAASGVCGTATTGFISNPYDINIDETGNLYIANSGGLSEISPVGKPMTCKSISGTSHGGTIDSTGKVWVGDTDNNVIVRSDPDPTSLLPTLSFPTTTPPYALAADGAGNIYYSTVTTATSQASIWKITAGASAVTPVLPIEISATVGATPARILVDGNNNIWASSQNNFISLISPAVSGVNLLNGYITTTVSTVAPTYGLSASSGVGANGVYVSAQSPSDTIDFLVGSGTSYASSPTFPTLANAGGLNVPSSIAIDGAQNVWSANDQPDSGTNLSTVSELTATGASLSADGTVSGGYQKALPYFVNGRTLAIDQAGNVWVGRDGSNGVSEIVGGAVPIFQPFAIGILRNRFQTIP